MISNRRGSRRSASPVERLREFSVNSSRGVDTTQAPVNSSTVSSTKNLIVNPDGSLSLRKPLKHVYTAGEGYAYHELFDGTTLAYTTSGNGITFRILRDRNFNSVVPTAVRVGEDTKTFYKGVTGLLAASDISFINLNNSTIVAGANISTMYKTLNDKVYSVIDPELYDKDVAYVPRYLRIEKGIEGQSSDGYTITVLIPEDVELTLSDSEPKLNPNLVLDNPYSISDSSSKGAASVKGIVAYAYSTLSFGKPIGLPNVNKIDTAHSNKVLFHRKIKFTIDLSEEGVYSSELKATISEGIECSIKIDVHYTISESDDGDTYVSITPSITFSATTRNLSNTQVSNLAIGNNLHADGMYYVQGVGYQYNMDWDLPDYNAPTIPDPTYATYSKTLEVVTLEQSSNAWDTYTLEFNLSSFGVEYTVPTAVVPTQVPEDSDVLTRSNKETRYRPVTHCPEYNDVSVLKAFGTVPSYGASTVYYAAWYSSNDGVVWFPEKYTGDVYVNTSAESGVPSACYSRWDTVRGASMHYIVNPTLQYMYRVITVKEPEEKTLTLDEVNIVQEDLRISQVVYNCLTNRTAIFAYTEFANAVYGKKLYHKKRIFSYGHEKFFNNIFVSDIDNFNTPLYNVIDIDAKSSDRVTVLVPWRDYLVSATTNTMYIHTAQDNGYLTKTVTTSLGIPEADANCCVPILNGILAKSGAKVYLIYPNAYAGVDTVLNLNPISQPVDEYLEEFENNSYEKKVCFAFSTESEYILMLALKDRTTCLRYNYTTRVWCNSEYPVRLVDYETRAIHDVRVYSRGTGDAGSYTEYQFDADSDVFADQVSSTSEVPITFEWDSGQKTDNISTRKQFTESKIVFATQDEAENFPMELIVAVDGDPNIIRVDVRSDAPLLKTGESIGVLGTHLRMEEGTDTPGRATSGLLRQLVVRYSGRGRTVRHILKGVAKSPFRMYETYVRYKLIDNKR